MANEVLNLVDPQKATQYGEFLKCALAQEFGIDDIRENGDLVKEPLHGRIDPVKTAENAWARKAAEIHSITPIGDPDKYALNKGKNPLNLQNTVDKEELLHQRAEEITTLTIQSAHDLDKMWYGTVNTRNVHESQRYIFTLWREAQDARDRIPVEKGLNWGEELSLKEKELFEAYARARSKLLSVLSLGAAKIVDDPSLMPIPERKNTKLKETLFLTILILKLATACVPKNNETNANQPTQMTVERNEGKEYKYKEESTSIFIPPEIDEMSLEEKITLIKEIGNYIRNEPYADESYYQIYAKIILSETDVENRRELIRAYNKEKYPEQNGKPVAITRQDRTISATALTAMDTSVPMTIGELELLKEMGSNPMERIHSLEPTIIFLENAEMAKIAFPNWNISPQKNVIIETPDQTLEGFSWMQDSMGDAIKIDEYGNYVIIPTNYKGKAGQSIKVISELLPQIFNVEAFNTSNFQGGNLEILRIDNKTIGFTVKGNREETFSKDIKEVFQLDEIIELLPVNESQHADEMLTIHQNINGQIVLLIASPPTDANNNLIANYEENTRIIQSIFENIPHLEVFMPTRKLPTVNIAHFERTILLPLYDDLTMEEVLTAQKNLEEAFPNEKISFYPTESTAGGGTNCLTGSLPIEIYYLLRELLEETGDNHFTFEGDFDQLFTK